MSFDLLAPHYRWMECLSAGDKLQRCRIAFLREATAARNVLIAGEGNGRFLCELLPRLFHIGATWAHRRTTGGLRNAGRCLAAG